MDSRDSGLLGIPQLGNHVPFSGKQYPLNMGLQPLEFPGDWIQVDDHYLVQMEKRKGLLTDRSEEVFGSLPEGAEGSKEVLELLLQHLPTVYPNNFELVEGGLSNKTTGVVVAEQSDEHPLLRAAKLVQEDLLLMYRAEDGQYRLGAGVLCFPSRWLLKEKLGQTTQLIHGPVPFYKERIAGKVDDLMSRVKGNKPLYRINWSVHDVEELFQPTRVFASSDKVVTAENAGTTTFMRFERQTLSRLPRTQEVLFTIHTYVRELQAVLNTKELAREFLANVKAMPQAAIAYKGMAEFFPEVVKYVEKFVGDE